MRRKSPEDQDRLAERCLRALIEAGTLEVSLDQLAQKVDSSKRMLIHYFGSRENLEQSVMVRLEDRLRKRFQADAFPSGVSLRSVVMALWERTTAAESRGILLLIMDVSRRGWSGSERAQAFYREQQRLWVELLQNFQPDGAAVEELLQLFQGAVLAYLVTGDREQGRRTLTRMLSRDARKPFS